MIKSQYAVNDYFLYPNMPYALHCASASYPHLPDNYD